MDPDPGGGPSDRFYVPIGIRSQVLQWGALFLVRLSPWITPYTHPGKARPGIHGRMYGVPQDLLLK